MDTNPLTTAHVRNQHVVEELRKLRDESSVLNGQGPDFADYYPKMIANLQRIYRQLLAATDALQFIGLEGVQRVSFGSASETLTWSPSEAVGADLAGVLLEHLSDRLSDVENRIVEAKARLAGELTGGTAEEWHHENVHSLTLLLEEVPQFSPESEL